MERRVVTIEGSLDLRRTLAPLHGRFENDGWWLTSHTPDGPASLRVSRSRSELVGDAWGTGAGSLLERLCSIAGFDDDPSQFVTDHPLVSRLHRQHPGWRYGRTGLVFDALIVATCGQKVTGREAAMAIHGLHRKFGSDAPGPKPDLRLPPDPGAMAAAPYWEFHDLHLEKRRADLIRAVSSEHRRIEALAEAPVEEAAAALSAVRGVGPWTVAKTLEVSHGDSDQVPVGDFHLKHTVVHHLTGRDRGTDDQMLELLEPFRPHRGRVVRLLHTLGHAPKFGPRLRPRDITGM